jgi:hypothetical protein
MKEALSESLFIGLLMFVLARILWDWLASGRVKKGDCVSLDACERYREKCCIGEVKTDFSANKRELEAYKAELNARISVAEKRLDEGRQSFAVLRGSIGHIQEDLSGMRAILERLVEEIKDARGKQS